LALRHTSKVKSIAASTATKVSKVGFPAGDVALYKLSRVTPAFLADARHLTRLCDVADGLEKHLRGVFEGGIEIIRGSPRIGELLNQPRLVFSGSVKHRSLRHVRTPSRDPSLSRCPWPAFSWFRRSTRSRSRCRPYQDGGLLWTGDDGGKSADAVGKDSEERRRLP